MESPPLPPLIIAVVQWRRDVRQQSGEPRLPLDQRQRAEVLTIEMQKVEDKIQQPAGIASVRRGLDHAERGDAVGVDAAEVRATYGAGFGPAGGGAQAELSGRLVAVARGISKSYGGRPVVRDFSARMMR